MGRQLNIHVEEDFYLRFAAKAAARGMKPAQLLRELAEKETGAKSLPPTHRGKPRNV